MAKVLEKAMTTYPIGSVVKLKGYHETIPEETKICGYTVTETALYIVLEGGDKIHIENMAKMLAE